MGIPLSNLKSFDKFVNVSLPPCIYACQLYQVYQSQYYIQLITRSIDLASWINWINNHANIGSVYTCILNQP